VFTGGNKVYKRVIVTKYRFLGKKVCLKPVRSKSPNMPIIFNHLERREKGEKG